LAVDVDGGVAPAVVALRVARFAPVATFAVVVVAAFAAAEHRRRLRLGLLARRLRAAHQARGAMTTGAERDHQDVGEQRRSSHAGHALQPSFQSLDARAAVFCAPFRGATDSSSGASLPAIRVHRSANSARFGLASTVLQAARMKRKAKGTLAHTLMVLG